MQRGAGIATAGTRFNSEFTFGIGNAARGEQRHDGHAFQFRIHNSELAMQRGASNATTGTGFNSEFTMQGGGPHRQAPRSAPQLQRIHGGARDRTGLNTSERLFWPQVAHPTRS